LPPRGKIVDRNGVPIAVNRMGYAVKIAKTGMTEKEKNEMILKLINIFEKNGDSYEKNLSNYLTFNPIALVRKTSLKTHFKDGKKTWLSRLMI